MPSFQITLTPNRRAAARFIGQVRRALQKAYIEEQTARGLSQSEIARALKVHRSVINRELKGLRDISVGRVAELSWAMGRKPLLSLTQSPQPVGANQSTGIDQDQRAKINAATPPPATSVNSHNGIRGLVVA
jgi:DNA-binding CsgD family transcriptional regulator